MRAKELRVVPTLKEIQRFHALWEERADGCWVWTRARFAFYWRKRYLSPRRFAWRIYRDVVPARLDVVNTCGTEACVNPWHAELRPRAYKDGRVRPERCRNGHLLTEDNLVWQKRPGGGNWRCRSCQRRKQRDYMRRKNGTQPEHYNLAYRGIED